MPDIETAQMYLSAARRDLQALENMLSPTAFPSEIFGFHAQQAVEKALKAWLAIRDRESPRTHNIRHLIVLLEATGIEEETLWDFIDLTAFAVQFRYEMFETLDEKLNRPQRLSDIQSLVSRIEALLKIN
jgi:HEPN domain-containing protein